MIIFEICLSILRRLGRNFLAFRYRRFAVFDEGSVWKSDRSFRMLEEGDEPSSSGLDYIPAPDSPSAQNQPDEEDDEEDPLDAYMAGIEVSL